MARAMKDSGIEWIGEIPEGWEVDKTKHYYTNHKDIAGNRSEEFERLALTLNGVIKRPKDDSTGLQPEAFNGYQIMRSGELVFKLIDLENVSTSRVGYSPFTGIVSPAYIILQPNEAEESLYGVYYFLSMWQREIFNHMGDDGVRSSLNASDLLNIPYLRVPNGEKARIVSFLDAECARIDAVIEQTRASIEEYKRLKQAIITQAVTKGIRPGRKMKDSGVEWIGEIPEEWTLYKTKAIAKRIVVGVVIKPADYFDDDGTVPFLRGINVKEYRVNNSPMVYINETTNEILSKSVVHAGDILVVRDGSIGVSAVVPEEYDGANVVSMIIVTCNDLVLPDYLCYSLNSDVGKTQFNLFKIGTALTHTSVQSVSNLLHLVPPMEEQIEIVNNLKSKVASFETLIQMKEKIIAELESYKKSLIFEYVTGKKEVKV